MKNISKEAAVAIAEEMIKLQKGGPGSGRHAGDGGSGAEPLTYDSSKAYSSHMAGSSEQHSAAADYHDQRAAAEKMSGNDKGAVAHTAAADLHRQAASDVAEKGPSTMANPVASSNQANQASYKLRNSDAKGSGEVNLKGPNDASGGRFAVGHHPDAAPQFVNEHHQPVD